MAENANIAFSRTNSTTSHDGFVRLSASELPADLSEQNRLANIVENNDTDDSEFGIAERRCRSLDALTYDDYEQQHSHSTTHFDSLDSSHEKKTRDAPSLVHNARHSHMPESWSDVEGLATDMPHALYGNESSALQRQKEENSSDQGEKIKSKLMTAWNNMKHGWTVKTRTNFRYDSAIILLGKCYCNSKSEREDQKKQLTVGGPVLHTSFDRFVKDFSSRIWCTYRKDFPKLYGSQITSDVGWGCMLRSGQMMLAQAFSQHFHGREWTLSFSPHKRSELVLHRQIIRLFADMENPQSPFSIHKLVRIGIDHGKRPGDWYGPASVAYVLRDALEQAPKDHPLLNQLCIYVAPDCTVYKQDLTDLCTRPAAPSGGINSETPHSLFLVNHNGQLSSNKLNDLNTTSAIPSHFQINKEFLDLPTSENRNVNSEAGTISSPKLLDQSDIAENHQGAASVSSSHAGEQSVSRDQSNCDSAPHWKAAVVLVPVRLGGENLNPIYMQCVQALLAHDLCLGIIGGRPKHSLYFIGWQEDKLIHLDPHFCQDSIDMRLRDFPLESYHCQSPRKMSVNKMDPSCTLCFYCPSRESVDVLEADVKRFAMPVKEKGMYPLFVFQDGHCADIEKRPAQPPKKERYLRVRHIDEKGRVRQSSAQGKDDFVFL